MGGSFVGTSSIRNLVRFAAFFAIWCWLSADANAQVGGVSIDAQGVLSMKPVSAKAALASVRRAARDLEGDLAESSELRFISLRALLNASGDRARETMAGLTSVRYVIGEPESEDIFLAGPAEPFAEDLSGRRIGAKSGRPVLDFVHLVEALQYAEATIGCSIDPEPQRQKELNDYLRANSTPATPSQIAARYKRMALIIGRQNIRVFGVPRHSSLALAAIEADFLLKQIALGVRPSGVRSVKSHLALLRPNGNTFQRWWFAPQYDEIFTDEARLAFELTGPRLKLLAQDEMSDANGVRFDAAVTSATTQLFAKAFSARMDDLARVNASFATLQNATDLIMAAALIRSERLSERTGFDPFAAAAKIEIAPPSWAEPQTVPSFAMTKRSGSYVLGLVGGVVIDGRQMTREFRPQVAETRPVTDMKPRVPAGQFWANDQ